MTRDWDGCSDEEVFATVYPALRRWAAVVAPAPLDPDDLVQEALTRTLAISTLSSFSDPLAYLRVAIIRLAANERRRLGRARNATAQLVAETTVNETYPSDLADLAALKPEDRALLYLTEVEGLSLREASRFFPRSMTALKMRRHRALRKLRKLIEDEAEDA